MKLVRGQYGGISNSSGVGKETSRAMNKIAYIPGMYKSFKEPDRMICFESLLVV